LLILIILSLSRRPYYYPYHVTLITTYTALITTLIASPLPLPILLFLLFNPPNPTNPSNYIESFITTTGQTTRRGGSSYVLSSYTAGKAPTIL
jgi:hypothetical protein